MTAEPSLEWRCDCELGMAPVWLPEAQALLLVDAARGRLLSYDPVAGTGSFMTIGGRPSFVFPTADGQLLVGSERELLLVDRDGALVRERRIDSPEHTRTGAATVDVHGRLWFGMTGGGKGGPMGGLLRYHDDRLVPQLFDLARPGGPAVTADGRTLYHVDMPGRTIYRFAVASAGSLSNPERFLGFSDIEGHPCSVTLDAEQCLWVTMWEGGCVQRYSPSGALLATVAIPSACVTGLAFGGADLTRAFVTTARAGEREDEPLAGGLFGFDVAVPGRVIPAVVLGHGDLGLIDDDDHHG